MNRIKEILSVAMITIMAIGVAPVSAEEAFEEGMLQTDFAKMLVRAIDAEGYLPPAAVENDYFIFLTQLGVVPPDGWDPEGVITRDDLIAMLGEDPLDVADLSFADLVEMLKESLKRLISEAAIFKPLTVTPETQ